ncbi:ABC transporter transmembrane domain-containing protein [Sphingomonas sp. BGYR3]|uniref:ABC transporter transmembrane domain-containing protein n=1 Tax=Sphingomonas sp. BGYR3 TaxID=2975483 RepID=UPI0021A43CAB|nr:ABC transporter transmembrane domain-containing protein [Sphingomonas sp. BGYR3]MDG5488254.1 ABC transporter transmembrane domain-containing protein [Sphingomonas sp. BGYR3]
MADQGQRVGVRAFLGWISLVMAPDGGFVRLALVYGIAISLLSLATPISVQLLINSVANIALPAPLFTLSAMLFLLLLIAGVLMAFRVHLMALFERRLFARITAEITLRAVHAQNPFFGDERRGDLFNRFFDMMTVQKAMPSLLIGGFTIVLQGAVGLIVTSFYHPFFLAFNMVLVLVLFLIWQVWASGAIRTAVGKSHAKHGAAHWLESVGGSNGFYKSSRHLAFAMDKSEAVTATYVDAHKRHFRYTFAQTLCLLFTWAAASATLLALGGWLIIQNQLSIGQLVAAELILSGVFYGIAQLGFYLESLYDLAAGLEELALFWAIPQEPEQRGTGRGPADGSIRFRGVQHHGVTLDFEVAAGKQLAVATPPGLDRTIAFLLRRHETAERGIVTVGGADIASFDMYRLRADIRVLDRPTIVEMSIRNYLTLSSAEDAMGIMDALDIVGLTERIGALPHGLDTHLSSSGWPLSVGETMALKLAAALLARPRVLMLSPLLDLLPVARVDAVLARMRESQTTVLQFTRRPEGLARDGHLWIGRREQLHCEGEGELIALARGEGGSHALSA